MEYSDLSGSYKWTVYVSDSQGQSRTLDGFFTYGESKSYTITNLDFGEITLENNTEDVKETLLLENTGNTIFNVLEVSVIDEEFFDEDGVESFEYEDKIGFAETKERLDSNKFYTDLEFDEDNVIYNGTLNPGSNSEVWFKLMVDSTIEPEVYTALWDATVSEVSE